MKKTKRILLVIIAAILFLVVSTLLFGCQEPLEGEKSVTCYFTTDTSSDFCYIVINDGAIQNLNENNFVKYTCKTDAITLEEVFEVLKDKTSFTYSATIYEPGGAFLDSICGIAPPPGNFYIEFKIDGETASMGISAALIADKAVYSFCITGW